MQSKEVPGPVEVGTQTPLSLSHMVRGDEVAHATMFVDHVAGCFVGICRDAAHVPPVASDCTLTERFSPKGQVPLNGAQEVVRVADAHGVAPLAHNAAPHTFRVGAVQATVPSVQEQAEQTASGAFSTCPPCMATTLRL
jgi:hypothetical protein